MKEKLEKLIEEGLSTHGIAKALGLGQTTTRYWLKKYNLKTLRAVKEQSLDKVCTICGSQLTGRQIMFCSNQCKQKAFQASETFASSSWKLTQDRGVKLKTDIVLSNDGCSLCHYKKNLAALTFHHKDATLKDFSLSMRRLGSVNKLLIETELEKCQLLCMNCHMEVESPNLKIGEATVKCLTTTTGLDRKMKLLDEVGHTCSKCNYSENYRALCFHHLDESIKSFSLDINTCQKKSMGDLRVEASKCVVLCGNCHMEEHHPHLNI